MTVTVPSLPFPLLLEQDLYPTTDNTGRYRVVHQFHSHVHRIASHRIALHLISSHPPPSPPPSPTPSPSPTHHHQQHHQHHHHHQHQPNAARHSTAQHSIAHHPTPTPHSLYLDDRGNQIKPARVKRGGRNSTVDMISTSCESNLSPFHVPRPRLVFGVEGIPYLDGIFTHARARAMDDVLETFPTHPPPDGRFLYSR